MNIIDLSEVKTDMLNKIGGKALQLGLLMEKGINIPHGFVICTAFYERFVQRNGIDKVICEALKEKQCKNTSKRIQQSFSQGTFSKDEIDLLQELFHKQEKPFAIRSSSILEDMKDFSFAGQYDSYLNIHTFDLFLEAIVKTWASLWNTRAITYRRQQGLEEKNIRHAVLVQHLIKGEKSGIAFSANPITGIRHHTLINASWGLGESIVGGEVTPDEWVINRDTGEILKEIIRDKKVKTVCCDNGTKQVNIPSEEVKKTTLTENELQNLCQTINTIQSHYNNIPQDIEWVISQGELFIVQSRAITTLFPVPTLIFESSRKHHCYLCFSTIAQGIHEPLTPMGIESYKLLFCGYTELYTGQYNSNPDWIATSAGRFYIDVADMLAKKKYTRKIVARIEQKDVVASKTLEQYAKRESHIYRKQGSRFRFHFRMLQWIWMLTKDYFKGARLKEQAKNAMIELGDQFVEEVKADIKQCNTFEKKLQYLGVFMQKMSKFGFSSFMYCVKPIMQIDKVEKKIKKWLGNHIDITPIKQALLHNPTTEMGEELMKLAVYYKDKRTKPTANDQKIQDFLKIYGHRGSVEMDIGTPRWIEDPQYILDIICSYIESDPASMLQAFEEKKIKAERLINSLHQQITLVKGKRKAKKIAEFLRLYRYLAGMRERPKFDLIRGSFEVRNMIRTLGAELVQNGFLKEENDIFFLTINDIKTRKEQLQAIGEKNKAMYKSQFRYTRIPPVVINDGETLYNYRLENSENVYNGSPVASGSYTGKVKVIEHLGDDELHKGEILVTHSTNPAWTPLFLKAGALIMESGGPISHGSVVAREYGIPAVVYGDILHTVKTGDTICVNGDSGQIEIVS